MSTRIEKVYDRVLRSGNKRACGSRVWGYDGEGGLGHVDGCGWCDEERGSGAQPKLNRMINNR